MDPPRGPRMVMLSEERDPREILVTFGEGVYKWLAQIRRLIQGLFKKRTLKGSFKGDIDPDIDIEVDVDIERYFGSVNGFPK